MKLLVVGSCTGKKNKGGCTNSLREADFDDPATLRRREAELARWASPAAELYTGLQHLHTMKGVDAIRRNFGSAACALKIISAGYGLVSEERSLVPYEATFQHKRRNWIHERALRLGIAEALQQAIRDFEAVIFLLGKEYLIAANSSSLVPVQDQRLIFLTCNSNLRYHPSSTIVPSGLQETRFGAGLVALKGRMFELFAYGLCCRPDAWNTLLSDPTAETFLNLVEAGREQA